MTVDEDDPIDLACQCLRIALDTMSRARLHNASDNANRATLEAILSAGQHEVLAHWASIAAMEGDDQPVVEVKKH